MKPYSCLTAVALLLSSFNTAQGESIANHRRLQAQIRPMTATVTTSTSPAISYSYGTPLASNQVWNLGTGTYGASPVFAGFVSAEDYFSGNYRTSRRVSPLRAESRTTEFDADRRMRSKIRLDRRGVLHVDIELRTEPGIPLYAGTVVGILDRDGNYMWSMKAPGYNLSGSMLVGNSPTRLKRHWSKQIPADLARHIDGLIIINTTEPEHLLQALLANQYNDELVQQIMANNEAEFYYRDESYDNGRNDW